MALDTNLLTRNDGLKYTQLVLDGTPINAIDESIKENNNLEHSTNVHIGEYASDTSFISQAGRRLTFKSVVHAIESSQAGREHKIQDYQDLFDTYKKTAAYLVSNSYAKYNGKYIITKFDKEEENGGSFVIDWELQEVITAPVTSKTFRVWDKAPPATTKTTTTKKVTVSYNTKYLLTKCPTMSRKKYGTKTGLACVKRLQIFLQASGYFLKHKTNGNFSKSLETALKKVQKKRKLPQTGVWDKKTIAFYKKLYKIK
jgi:hypothetical protein